jgi:hypothetical protein
MFQTEYVEKIRTHFIYNNFFTENRAVYEVLWNNMVKPDRQQMTICEGIPKNWENLNSARTTPKETVETRSYGNNIFSWSNSPNFWVALRNKAVSLCMLDTLSREYRHRLIVNVYCLSTATVVTRTRLNFTFTYTHIACLVAIYFVSCTEVGMVVQGTCELEDVANGTVMFVVWWYKGRVN